MPIRPKETFSFRYHYCGDPRNGHRNSDDIGDLWESDHIVDQSKCLVDQFYRGQRSGAPRYVDVFRRQEFSALAVAAAVLCISENHVGSMGRGDSTLLGHGRGSARPTINQGLPMNGV
jgi:hypothetical protein